MALKSSIVTLKIFLGGPHRSLFSTPRVHVTLRANDRLFCAACNRKDSHCATMRAPKIACSLADITDLPHVGYIVHVIPHRQSLAPPFGPAMNRCTKSRYNMEHEMTRSSQ